MYSIQKAAELLGKAEPTIRRWLKDFGIKLVEIEADRKRRYIADDDMKILVKHAAEKMVASERRTRDYHRHNSDVILIGGGKYYSFIGAASLLGVATSSVRRWARKAGIGVKLVKTDRGRWYIAQDDVVRIAEMHRRNLSAKALEGEEIERKISATETDVERLCSLKEVALYLDISGTTARRWIKEANLEVKTKFVGRKVSWITYGDVLHLADVHKCRVLANLPTMSERGEEGDEG